MNAILQPVRVLAVDDSPAMQQLLTHVIQADPGLKLIGVAGSAEEGWAHFARMQPDVVALDLELPGRPGIDLLRRIIRERPTPVVIVSANGGEGSAQTIEALAAGAVAFIDKPDTVTSTFEDFRVKLLTALKESAVAVSGPAQGGAPHRGAHRSRRAARRHPGRRLLAIGASTGGVVAIQKVLASLGAAPVPVLITQHMPPGYTARFAERLTSVTGFQAREAREGDRLQPGLA